MCNYKYIILLMAVLVCQSSCKHDDSGNHIHEHESEIDHAVEEEDDDVINLSQKQFEESGYEIGKLEERTFSNVLPATGKIHLPERSKAIVSSLIGGVVDGMSLIHGQWVKKGQVLFSISNPELIDIQQSYLELVGQLTYLEDEYARQKQMSVENISPKKHLLKAQSELQVAKAKKAGMLQRLTLIGVNPQSVNEQNLVSRLSVTAPISGYVTDIDVLNGGYLKATDPAIEISNTYHLHMELKILERDISKLEKEQKVRFTIQDDKSKTYKADVHLIEKHVNEDRMVNVHCHLEDDHDQHLIDGMYVTAEVLLDDRSALSLPESAIVTTDEHSHALRQLSGNPFSFEKVEVEIGNTVDGSVEILNASSFNEGTVFMTNGTYFLIKEESSGGHSH